MTTDGLCAFSAGYAEARHKFLEAAQHQGWGATSYLNPKVRGPEGELLFTDVVEIGDITAPAALFLVSGTHGVEGYFGSAAQIDALNRGITAPEGMKIVMVHAINPYGFAWNRRVTEDNVDLNRNFIDRTAPAPENAAYAQLKDAINPPSLAPDALRAADDALRAYVQAHGAFALQEAITRGQYAYPGGIYFGGSAETWSARTIRTIFHEHGKHLERVAMIDFHTGLGPRGAGEMIIEYAPGDPADARARAWWGAMARSTKAGESLSADLTGTMDAAFMQAFGSCREATVAALEVGTENTTVVFRALRADNWLHAHGDPRGPDAGAIRKACRDAFYCDADDWKEAVLGHARWAIDRAVEGFWRGA